MTRHFQFKTPTVSFRDQDKAFFSKILQVIGIMMLVQKYPVLSNMAIIPIYRKE